MVLQGNSDIMIGNGDKVIVYRFYDTGTSASASKLMRRFAQSCLARAKYDLQTQALLKVRTLILTESNNSYHADLCVVFNHNLPGVYALNSVPSRQLARMISARIGLKSFALATDALRIPMIIEIGLGDKSDFNQLFFHLKDIMYELPLMV